MTTRKYKIFTNTTARVFSYAIKNDPVFAEDIIKDYINNNNNFKNKEIVKKELSQMNCRRMAEISTMIGKPFKTYRDESDLTRLIKCDTEDYETAYGYNIDEAMNDPAIIMPAIEPYMAEFIIMVLGEKNSSHICMGFIDSENNTLIVDMTLQRKKGQVIATHIIRDVIRPFQAT